MNKSRRLLTWYILGAAVFALAFAGGTIWFTHSSVNAQPYGITLPADVQSFSILSNGAPVSTTNDGQVPVLNTTTPEFAGQLTPGVTSATITLVNAQQVTSSTAMAALDNLNAVSLNGPPTQITVTVDPITGKFVAHVSGPLSQGTYFLYVDGSLVDEFVIAS